MNALWRHPHLAVALCAWTCLATLALVLALGWVGRPFPGFLVQENLAVSTLNLKDWSGVKAGIEPLSRVVAVEGRAVASPEALARAVAAQPPGTPLRYECLRPDHSRTSLTVPTGVFTWWDFTRFFLGFWGGGVLHLIVGAVVIRLRPASRAARAHWHFCQAIALFLLLKFDANTTHVFTELSYCSFGLLVPALVGLGLIFPVELASERTRRRLQAGAWGLALLGGLAFFLTFSSLSAWPVVAKLLIMIPSVLFLGFIGLWAWEAMSSRVSPLARSQAQVIMAGMALSVVPSILHMIPGLLLPRMEGGQFQYLTLAFFPLAVGFAIVRHQAFDIEWVIRRVTLYTLLAVLLSALYVAATTAGYALTGSSRAAGWPGLVGAIAVALSMQPLYRLMRRRVDRLMLGERADVLALLLEFQQRGPSDRAALGQELAAIVGRAFQPSWLELRAGPRVLARLGEPPVLPEDITTEGVQPLDAVAEGCLAIGLAARGERVASLALGPRANQMPYGSQDLAILNVLAGQAAAALQNAALYEAHVALAAQEALSRRLAEERRQILQQVIHDVRSDLFNIQLAAEAVAPGHKGDGPVGSIRRSLSRIDDLLGEKARWIREGRSEASSPLLPVLSTAAIVLDGQLAQRHQRLHIRRPEADMLLPLSEVEFLQILINLLSNASKYSPPGTEVRLNVRLEEGNAVIVVQDEGPGLSPALLADPTLGRRGDETAPGMGLGLQNVRAIVERAGGALAWRNGERGAVFTVRLPLQGHAPADGGAGPAHADPAR